MQSSDDKQQRPRGILKNSSFHQSPPNASTLPTSADPPLEATSSASPGTVATSTDSDLTLQNTLQNAGHRRTSSNARNSMSRRQSSNARSSSGGVDQDAVDNQRLKWDELNIYKTEQEKSSTMKIDEPKTPYAKRYDPQEDEEEIRTLDAQDLMVDELDKVREGRSRQAREDQIPGLDIGEPEEDVSYVTPDDSGRIQRSGSVKGEKQVQVDGDAPDGKRHDGTVRHKDFEEMRKKHYEMKDVRERLGHPADDLMDEDEDDAPASPPVPKLNQKIVNGA